MSCTTEHENDDFPATEEGMNKPTASEAADVGQMGPTSGRYNSNNPAGHNLSDW